jgi:hypothetical protein
MGKGCCHIFFSKKPYFLAFFAWKSPKIPYSFPMPHNAALVRERKKPMQTLIQFAFMLAFILFAMLAVLVLHTSPIAALTALVIAAMCALAAIVSVLQENAARF